MGRDKARTASTKSMECIAPTVRSGTRTLTAYAAAISLGAMIGLGALSGCAGDRGEDNNGTGESQSEHAGSENAGAGANDGVESGTEHAGADNPESESEDGEESGATLGLDETYDFVRKGTRLILRYDAESNSFVGTVQNTTGEVLNSVRVEVHLSNGTELGPTTPVDLAPGEAVEVSLTATEEPFTGWTPHAEVGEGEHGGGGEGGEHESDGGGEHGEGREGGGEHGGGEGGGEHGEGGEHGGSGEGGEGAESDGEHGGGE